MVLSFLASLPVTVRETVREKLGMDSEKFHQVGITILISYFNAFSALMLLVWWQEQYPANKQLEWWDAGMVICFWFSPPLQ